MKKIVLIGVMLAVANVSAEEIFRIEIGRDYNKYSDSDLRRRVWELEKAVWQLQQRVFQLELGKQGGGESWLCRISAMGDTFTGTGASKALATEAATKECKAAHGGDGFFCKEVKCEK